MRKDPRTRSASEQLQAEGKSASISTADILSLNNNRLTFTESATQRLLASNVAIQNAKLELSLDTSLTISGTLVQHGEQTRRSKESELPYQVVAGTMVIDVSALPADQLQKLQAYLRAVGKSE